MVKLIETILHLFVKIRWDIFFLNTHKQKKDDAFKRTYFSTTSIHPIPKKMRFSLILDTKRYRQG